MKLVLISDTHNKLGIMKIPDGDVLVHAGDATIQGTPAELHKFCLHLAKLPHKHKVIIAGNHDWFYQKNRPMAEATLYNMVPGAKYLQDSGCEIDGLTFWGSPWQPRFFNWAFNLDRGHHLRRRWQKVPTGVDVLVTHSPPRNVLDGTTDGRNEGCDDLSAELQRIKPRLHVFGHLHYGYGQREIDGTTYVNASILDDDYRIRNEPVVIDLQPTTKEAA